MCAVLWVTSADFFSRFLLFDTVCFFVLLVLMKIVCTLVRMHTCIWILTYVCILCTRISMYAHVELSLCKKRIMKCRKKCIWKLTHRAKLLISQNCSWHKIRWCGIFRAVQRNFFPRSHFHCLIASSCSGSGSDCSFV